MSEPMEFNAYLTTVGVLEEFQEILQGTKEELPPLREINHKVKLIDLDKRYTYRLPTCPVTFRDQFHTKLEWYMRVGWWKEQSVAQAAPLMCIPKKDGKLRTVIDTRQRNDNTVKDVTPMPDQELIREDVARAKYMSKFDTWRCTQNSVCQNNGDVREQCSPTGRLPCTRHVSTADDTHR